MNRLVVKNCCKDRTVSGTLFKSEKSLKDHHKCKWKVASRAGTRAERLVISKRKKRAMEARGQILMEGEPLKHAFTFTYLGHDLRADGKAEHAIEERMRKAALRFSRPVMPHLEEQGTGHYTKIEAACSSSGFSSCVRLRSLAYYRKGDQVGRCMERQKTFIHHK